METTMTLVPIQTGRDYRTKEPRHEMIRLDDDRGYPSALFHIDTLHTQGGNEIYTALYEGGKPLKVKVTFEIIEE